VPAATVCVDLSCFQISSHKNPFLGWGTHRVEYGTTEFGGAIRTVVERTDLHLGNGVKYGDVCGGILHIAELSKCADCMT